MCFLPRILWFRWPIRCKAQAAVVVIFIINAKLRGLRKRAIVALALATADELRRWRQGCKDFCRALPERSR
jgi:hypothetical protein